MVFLQPIGKSIFDYLDMKMQFHIAQKMPEYRQYLRIELKFGNEKRCFRENHICETCIYVMIENMLFELGEGIGERVLEEYEILDGLYEFLEKTINRVYQRELYEYLYEKEEVGKMIYPHQSKKKDFCIIHHLKINIHEDNVSERVYRAYKKCIEDYIHNEFCEACGDFGHKSYSVDCLFVEDVSS